MNKTLSTVTAYAALGLMACSLSGERTYGGARNQNAVEILPTGDGGAIVCGHTVTGNDTGSDLYVLRLDDEGEVAWSFTDGGAGSERGAGVVAVGDDFVVAATTESEGPGDPENYGSYANLSVTRLDDRGNRVWKRVYGETLSDGAADIALGSSGQVAIAGYTHNSSNAPSALVVRYTADGDLIGVTKVEDPLLRTVANAIAPTADGGFLVAGSGFVPGEKSDGVLVRLAADGTVQWTRRYGAADKGEVFEDVQPTSDGGFIAAGYVSDWWPEKRNTDAWLIKVAANGDIEWEGTYGGDDNDEATAVQPVAGGYVFTGATNSFGDATPLSDDIWVVGVSASGVQQWSRTYGGSGNNYGTDVRVMSGGELLVSGDTFPDFSLVNAYDIYVARLSATGEL